MLHIFWIWSQWTNSQRDWHSMKILFLLICDFFKDDISKKNVRIKCENVYLGFSHIFHQFVVERQAFNSNRTKNFIYILKNSFVIQKYLTVKNFNRSETVWLNLSNWNDYFTTISSIKYILLVKNLGYL